ncbi:PrkA family serine protein kinase [Halobacteriaceae archaeon GCM10025711]
MREYIRDADRALGEAYDEPMTLEEYVETAFEDPAVAAHAAKYILDAIEAAGTREVIEDGEEKTRYRFFDDPYNDGEHAVLGNTEELNAFVDDLRAIAAGHGKAEKIIWFAGPTATGKSELKRCLVNGLHEFSKTPEGRRYTVEWNVSGAGDNTGLTYGDATATNDDEWYESPVQAHPLSVFPSETRTRLLTELNEDGDGIDVRVNSTLDPFCREAYDYLEEQYRRRGRSDLFSAITDRNHLRVKNYVMDLGQGIGVLHSEDTGSPKERLVGSWMGEMLRKLDSRGRKNPQAFSYDGVLSQGNGGLTIVEDAAQHADLLQKLLNVPDEQTVKLDKGIGMDIDTQLLIISNPDLEAQLNQHADRQGQDPLKALKRRLSKHSFTYLTNLSLEAELLHRELTDHTTTWDAESYDELAARIREPVTISVRDGPNAVYDRELAPHAIEAAALYSVVTRLDDADVPTGLDLVEKALLFDKGYIRDGDDVYETGDFEFDPDAADGTNGIPVTYTRDVISDLLHARRDRRHPDLPVEHVITPNDVLNEMVEGLAEAPMFSAGERAEYENRVVAVKDHIVSQQEQDVIDAMLRDRTVEEETVEEYVEHIYAQATESTVENDRGEEVEPDPLVMKVFEVEHLGRFTEDDYDGRAPSADVREFREGRIITALNRHAWEHRTDDFRIDDVDLREIPVIKSVLESSDWDAVRRTYEDFDPEQWENPPTGTETESLKAQTIENMQELFGYTAASAELASQRVMNEVSYQWD